MWGTPPTPKACRAHLEDVATPTSLSNSHSQQTWRALETKIQCWFRCRGAATNASGSVEEQADGQLYSLYIVRVCTEKRYISICKHIYYIHSRPLRTYIDCAVRIV